MTKLLLYKSLILILFSFCISSSKNNRVSKEDKKHSKVLPNKCDNAIPSKTFEKDAKKGKIFMVLSEEETNQVVSWMINSNPDLNLTSFDSASLNDNYVYKVTLSEPDKTQALAYIENDSKKPIRSARVVFFIFVDVIFYLNVVCQSRAILSTYSKRIYRRTNSYWWFDKESFE